LHQKGVSLAQLARCNLNFDRQAYAVYDGHELRGCRDAAAAIAAVVHAKRWCSVIDLSAIRTGIAECYRRQAGSMPARIHRLSEVL
jgi:hypothetical protein